MTLEEIKKAVDNGQKVCWSNPSYTVKKDEKLDRYYVEHVSGYIFLLTNKDGELEDKEVNYKLEEDILKEAREANFIVT